LTEHDDVKAGAPRLGLALGPASARAGPGHNVDNDSQWNKLSYLLFWWLFEYSI